MTQMKTKPKPTFFQKNKDLLVVGGVIVVLSGAALTYYLLKKKKEKKELASTNNDITTSHQTPPFVPVTSGTGSSGSSNPKPIITKRGYPLKRGSRHPDVKILQRYLKIYKEDLGRFGPKRDGVDGVFGAKTERASLKRLKKKVFTQSDIAGMRKALISLGK